MRKPRNIMPTIFTVPEKMDPKLEILFDRAMALLDQSKERGEEPAETLMVLLLAARVICLALTDKSGIRYEPEVERLEAKSVLNLLSRWQKDGVHTSFALMRFSAGLTALAEIYLEKGEPR